MVSSERVSRAAELLQDASDIKPSEQDARLKRHLRVGAALREILKQAPVVVGGTAEDFYTADEYHETDLDVVTWALTEDEQELLVSLGFERPVGRHWYHPASGVALEIPEGALAGDPARVRDEPVASGRVLIIGPEDLYLDRVRQATSDLANESFRNSALAIAVSQYEQMDWHYVDERLGRPDEPGAMRAIDRRVRARARRELVKQR